MGARNINSPYIVTVRMSNDMHHIVHSVSQYGNVSNASVVRNALAEYFKDSISPSDSVPIRRKHRSKPAPNFNIVAIAELRESVAELVGTLRQVAGLSRKSGEFENHREIERLLPRTRDLVEFLNLLKQSYEKSDPDEIVL